MLKKIISITLASALFGPMSIAQDNSKNSVQVSPEAKASNSERSLDNLNRSPKQYADVSELEKKGPKERQKKAGERKYQYTGTKYQPVPLIGNLTYFGKDHETMLSYTKKYHSSRTKTFAAVMQRDRAGKIFSTMDNIFDKYDIPHEMKYLSVIESALNRNALSPVGAYGPWQFMPSTGRMMGLRVSSSADERADWVKSTHAACKYLNYLYNMFDDWLLVVASYNSGPRPVLNAIKKTGKNDFWSIKKYLPSETQNHVMAFVATATVFELMPEYATTGVPANFDWSVFNEKAGQAAAQPKEKTPLEKRFTKEEIAMMIIVPITEPVDLDYLCNFLDMDRDRIGKWNYDYMAFLMDYQPGETYKLRIPKDKLDRYIEHRDHIAKQSAKFLKF